VKKGLFEELSCLASSGRRFTPEDILSIHASTEYKICDQSERARIDALLVDYAFQLIAAEF
jgi:hypothetical protein